ncbi:MAG: hypothetical protein ACN4GR_07615 [Arenicellales bacterium]
MKLTFLAALLSLTSNVYAKTLYLDCLYQQCVAKTQCSDKREIALHFLVDTTNQKAWRLANPAARQVKLAMDDKNRYNLIDETKDGTIEVTTIDSRMHSSHSIHPMSTRPAGQQVRQYYGTCGERKMFAGLDLK